MARRRCSHPRVSLIHCGSTILVTDAESAAIFLTRSSEAQAFFVTRAKGNLRLTRHYSKPNDDSIRVHSDQVGALTLPKAREDYPTQLHRMPFYDIQNDRYFIFLTNNLQLPAEVIAKLYKCVGALNSSLNG